MTTTNQPEPFAWELELLEQDHIEHEYQGDPYHHMEGDLA